jgi:hypothetical protein
VGVRRWTANVNFGAASDSRRSRDLRLRSKCEPRRPSLAGGTGTGETEETMRTQPARGVFPLGPMVIRKTPTFDRLVL